jgi:hypothetical protein
LRIAVSAQSAEAAGNLHEELTKEVGEVATVAPADPLKAKFDREGFEKLRDLAG